MCYLLQMYDRPGGKEGGTDGEMDRPGRKNKISISLVEEQLIAITYKWTIFLQGEFISFADGDINLPVVEERSWERSSFHYDNIFHAMLTLFVVCTFEGWPG